MSVQAMTWVLENSRHKGSELLLMLVIANYAHNDGSNAFAGAPVLAKNCRLSIREVFRLIRRLESSGELIVNRSAGRHANRYTITMTNSDNMASRMNSDKMSPLEAGPTVTNSTPTVTNGDCHIRNRSHDPMNPKRGGGVTSKTNGKPAARTPPSSSSASPLSEPEKGPGYRKLATACRISLPATEREDSWLKQGLSELRRKMIADADANPDGLPVNGHMAAQAIESLSAFWKSEDWRGKRGEAPTPMQLVESYGAAKAWTRN
jgi:hypothetical protein